MTRRFLRSVVRNTVVRNNFVRYNFVRYGIVVVAILVPIFALLTALVATAQHTGAARPLVNRSAGSQLAVPSEVATAARALAQQPTGKTNRYAASVQDSSPFLPAVVYQSGGYESNAVAIADVNGDGKPDLVVADSSICDGDCGDGVVGILLGNGDGTFQPAVVYDGGPGYAVGVAVADVNGDGKLDLVVANQAVAVLLGNGDGTFQPGVAYGLAGDAPVEPNSVVVADVNGDGKPDLLVSLYGAQVDVLLGNGDGTFQPAVVYGPGCCGQGSLAVADVNGDGKPDLIVTAGNSDAVGIMLGNGDGTFQAQVNYDSGGVVPTSVAVADVNGDGKPDLLVANEASAWVNGFSSGPGSASVLLGNGDGTFQSAVVYPSPGPNYRSIAVADVNGDGKLDLLLAGCLNPTAWYCGGYTDGSLALHIGNGDGTFQPAVLFDSGGVGPISIAVADLNHDGRPDVAMANWAGSNGDYYIGTIGVLLNTGASRTSTTTSVASALNPSSYGQLVTFTAAVTSTSGTPAGTVIFYDGSTQLGSAALANGIASLSTSSLANGSHPITAGYQGSSGFAPSTSSPLNQMVNPAATTTSLISSVNPAFVHQFITYTATVTSQYGAGVTGTVAFWDGSTMVATVRPMGNQAAYGTAYMKAGNHSIRAVYSGDGNNVGSYSNLLTEIVEKASHYPTETTLTTSGSPSAFGQPVTFTATVSSNYGTIPDGEAMVFVDGHSEIGTGTTAGGIATFTTSSLTPTKHTIKALYRGDGTFRGSTGVTQQVVDRYRTATTVVSSLNPSTYGLAVTFTATVTSTGPSTPTGHVMFVGLGSATLSGGLATLTKTWLNAGTHSISAEYKGDSVDSPSTSSVISQVVNAATTTTAITSSENPSAQGQSVTFTATVTTSTGVNAAGTVTFTAGTTTLGTVALTSSVAAISTALLPTGATIITATYNGAIDFTGSSASLTQNVH